MNIPEEAIEAAARAMHPEVWDKALFVREYGEMAGRVHMRRAQKEWLGIARAALEAAAPLLVAQALREAADDAFKDKNTQGLARAVIGNWLRMKVAKIEEGL